MRTGASWRPDVRIAIDARELSGETTGVGRYLHHLLVEWARLPDAAAHQFSIYSPNGRLGLPPDFPGDVVLVPGDGGTRWEQGQFARALRKDRRTCCSRRGTRRHSSTAFRPCL